MTHAVRLISLIHINRESFWFSRLKSNYNVSQNEKKTRLHRCCWRLLEMVHVEAIHVRYLNDFLSKVYEIFQNLCWNSTVPNFVYPFMLVATLQCWSAMVATDALIEKVTNIAVPKLALLKRTVYVVLSSRISGWGQKIDVGVGYWRHNMLVTSLRLTFWSPRSSIPSSLSGSSISQVLSISKFCQRHPKIVTNTKMSPKLQNRYTRIWTLANHCPDRCWTCYD